MLWPGFAPAGSALSRSGRTTKSAPPFWARSEDRTLWPASYGRYLNIVFFSICSSFHLFHVFWCITCGLLAIWICIWICSPKIWGALGEPWGALASHHLDDPRPPARMPAGWWSWKSGERCDRCRHRCGHRLCRSHFSMGASRWDVCWEHNETIGKMRMKQWMDHSFRILQTHMVMSAKKWIQSRSVKFWCSGCCKKSRSTSDRT